MMKRSGSISETHARCILLATVRSIPCKVIRADFKTLKCTSTASLWIDQAGQEIRKVVYGGKDGRSTVTTVIISLDPSVVPPEDQFVFTPPPGAVRMKDGIATVK